MMISVLQSKIITFIFFFFLIRSLDAQPTHLYNYCYESGNYTANSLYKSNLDSLLSVLRSQSYGIGFYSYASGSSSTTTVYGNYLCRGDVSSSTCETCITRASRNVLIACAVQKEAIIWYEECFLKYSNRQILSIFDYGRFITQTMSTYTMTYSSYFINTVEYRMDLLIREAYSSSSYFAEETHHVSYLGEVYDLHGLVQCTPDLDQYDCYRCLKWAYNETEACCYGKSFALVYTTRCILTYKASFLAPPPPPPPPPPPFRASSENSGPDSDDSFSFKFKGEN
ncbi:hypothetical protein Bca52824_069329 [Brassica carinata]|uniref:Gnk2-homologous domain-containing protein n=1 Tax=Brassica carinata TaxID=52824 RepID=A0A8X7Q2C0_BRACI|nr:hypothetical protein Bca52824_069329 [Brassica carinata]